jgi:hypothetical protein
MTVLPRNDKKLRKRRRRKVIALVLAALLVYPSVTYVRALTYPGEAPFAVRTVDWARDMGLGGVVNAMENWWYTRHPPSTSPPGTDVLPPAPPSVSTVTPGVRPDPVQVKGPTLPGEGVWASGAKDAGGQVADYTTFIRPDPTHGSVVAGVAWLNQQLTRTTLIAGTKEPSGFPTPEGSQIPDTLRASLLATFNAGFKFKDINGGYYAHGQYFRPLHDGNASAVIDQNGVVSVAQWGRDATMSPNIQAVRQNLDLVVDGGHPMPGLAANNVGQWGSARSQFQYTWRSGLGTDKAGNLIYVAGNQLTLTTLADAMVQAGIVRGMQLDIHSDMVTFNTYRPDQPGSSPAKLLPTMVSQADRFLQPDQRDFFAVSMRPAHHPNLAPPNRTGP